MTADAQQIQRGLEDLLVVGDDLTELMSRYWSQPEFAGRTFDSLTPNPVHRIDAADLVAVSLLDVSFPPQAVRALLIDRAVEFGGMLSEVPANIDIWGDGAGDALDAAERMWEELCAFDDVEWVKAGKLLARKRPRLVPVYDSVVKYWFGEPAAFWRPLARVLRNEEGLRHTLEERLGRSSPDGVSLLRVIDVAIWMVGSRSQNAKRARAGLKLRLADVRDRLRYDLSV